MSLDQHQLRKLHPTVPDLAVFLTNISAPLRKRLTKGGTVGQFILTIQRSCDDLIEAGNTEADWNAIKEQADTDDGDVFLENYLTRARKLERRRRR